MQVVHGLSLGALGIERLSPAVGEAAFLLVLMAAAAVGVACLVGRAQKAPTVCIKIYEKHEKVFYIWFWYLKINNFSK